MPARLHRAHGVRPGGAVPRPVRQAHRVPRVRRARSRRVTEAEYMEVRAAEQAEIRRTFMLDAGVPPKRERKAPRERVRVEAENPLFGRRVYGASSL